MNQQSNIARVEELEAFAAVEGLTLPMPAVEIVRLEDMGLVIDLHTGQILEDVDIDEPIPFEIGGVNHESAI
ncbi:MAG: hypothetical protein KDE54_36450 [Caldilineaceae bacterium]|nr:hypothetical protein [Caldilineaceae bacterium]